MVSTSGRHWYQPESETLFGSRRGKRAVSARHTPRQNRLLAALPLEEYERLLPDLEAVTLPVGWPIHSAGGQQKYLYFITAGIVSRFYVTENGASAGFALTGSEGVVGIASFLGGDSTPSNAVVVNAGYAFRLRANTLAYERTRGGQLLRLLLRDTHSLIAQIFMAAVCNRHHSVEQQLCRLILSSLDRLPSNEVKTTHQMFADMLGVHREGITRAAEEFQEAGLIRYRRGHIVVLNRPGLETKVCECYAVVTREYGCLLPNFSNSKPLPGIAFPALHL